MCIKCTFCLVLNENYDLFLTLTALYECHNHEKFNNAVLATVKMCVAILNILAEKNEMLSVNI